MRTIETITVDHLSARGVTTVLIHMEAWFECKPLPGGLYEITAPSAVLEVMPRRTCECCGTKMLDPGNTPYCYHCEAFGGVPESELGGSKQCSG